MILRASQPALQIQRGSQHVSLVVVAAGEGKHEVVSGVARVPSPRNEMVHLTPALYALLAVEAAAGLDRRQHLSSDPEIGVSWPAGKAAAQRDWSL